MADKKETLPVTTATDRNFLMPEFTYNELLAELTKSAYMPELDPQNEVTVSMLMETTGRDKYYCGGFLTEMVKSGKLVKREVMHNGKRVNAYHDPNKWEPK